MRHPRFGLQFRASILERMKPEAADEVEQFLASGLISGIDSFHGETDCTALW